ncbi:chemotaxis protein CheW [Thiocystis violascens]|uniref:Chemotaxis signal transduction protein n=1 Tax=Thiocystis violascens (strain ATCC 17096 / DSM 198 / 6111) TaxID=765911 RepID=I3YDW0_THIV6|nr:chemotaxis protein CheW [Thiocystis violascens]AFL75178.1 chemotaxis signal transduction protein [Thiocystis violascens DSM 198]
MARTNRPRTDLHALIRDLDARCRARAAGLPDETKPPDSWAAVLFLVRAQAFLTPLEQIAEVLELPREITRVPGTKPWLLGVANNRGILLPIFHLAAFIEGTRLRIRAGESESGPDRRRETRGRERVLVVRQDELPCGLVVSEAIGMRYIKLGDRVDALPEGLGASKPYVDASFLLDGVPVPVIRLGRLMADPQFNAAMV